ncbi:MAG: hypothetical protein HRT66_00695 [Flavobacteriaceae bacterium]|nr:hypothetical protein [Flavobacteriaceae bacterium]
MGKLVFTVSESIKELKYLIKKSTNHRVKTRLLYLIMEDDLMYKRQKVLADFLGISDSSLKRWSKIYAEFGLVKMFKPLK